MDELVIWETKKEWEDAGNNLCPFFIFRINNCTIYGEPIRRRLRTAHARGGRFHMLGLVHRGGGQFHILFLFA
jgi:hypothetical protein